MVVETLNKIEDKFWFFVLVVLLVCFSVFTHSTGTEELAKTLVTAYAGYMAGKGKS